MNPEPTSDQEPPSVADIPPAKHRYIPHWCGCLFAFLAVGVLAGLILPGINSVAVKGPQTKALAQAKQIALALRLFAEENNGNYPRQGVLQEMKNAPTDSNTAFACLFPNYLQNETIFGNKLSAYQTAPPDNVIDRPYTATPKETLQPGENVYSYVMGLNGGDNPSTPLVMDGTDGTGHYQTDRRKRGGVWEGKKAVVVRLDNSAAVENLTGPENARYLPGRPEFTPGSSPAANLLDFSHFGRDVILLDPAFGPRRR